jgi:hypothetical protein
MGTDILQFMSSPAGIFLVALNSITLVFVAVTGFFVMRSAGRTLQVNSEANLMVIQQASKLSDTANTALNELTKRVGDTVVATQTAVTQHNDAAGTRHTAELKIQQQIADMLSRQTDALHVQSETIKRQTELMSSQVSIMQDMSESDSRVSETIETRIAPQIEALRQMLEQLLTRFENFSPDEIRTTLGTIQQSLDDLKDIMSRKDEPDVKNIESDAVDRPALPGGAVPEPGAGAGGDDGDDPAG